jgi:uncharacterized protein
VEPGELIAQVRRQAGLTQAQIARRAGTSQSMVARYESGVSSPTIDSLRRLIRAAGEELLVGTDGGPGRAEGGEGEPEPEPSPHGDLAGSVIWARRLALRAAAAELGIRKVRVFGPAACGGDPEVVDLLADFPVERRGMMPLLTLAVRVEQITGTRAQVWVPRLMTRSALRRARAEGMPL